jgi:hypothetical protein
MHRVLGWISITTKCRKKRRETKRQRGRGREREREREGVTGTNSVALG